MQKNIWFLQLLIELNVQKKKTYGCLLTRLKNCKKPYVFCIFMPPDAILTKCMGSFRAKWIRPACWRDEKIACSTACSFFSWLFLKTKKTAKTCMFFHFRTQQFCTKKQKSAILRQNLVHHKFSWCRKINSKQKQSIFFNKNIGVWNCFKCIARFWYY